MSISDNIMKIRKELPEDVTLISVSKTRTVEEIQQAYSAGERDFGENKVQELVDKYDLFGNDVRWHLIGHLQRNKVKYIVGKVHLIHSLDSTRLLEEIEKKFSAKGEIANVLIQVNIGREESKTGIFLDDLNVLLKECEKCSSVKVKGLMAIIPQGDEESCRMCFKQMKALFDEIKNKSYKNISMETLSMGMSGDFKIAIEEGSNMVRVGSSIFGERNYNK